LSVADVVDGSRLVDEEEEEDNDEEDKKDIDDDVIESATSSSSFSSIGHHPPEGGNPLNRWTRSMSFLADSSLPSIRVTRSFIRAECRTSRVVPSGNECNGPSETRPVKKDFFEPGEEARGGSSLPLINDDDVVVVVVDDVDDDKVVMRSRVCLEIYGFKSRGKGVEGDQPKKIGRQGYDPHEKPAHVP